DAVDLRYRRHIDRERASCLQHAVTDVDEVRADLGDFIDERLGRQGPGGLKLLGCLGAGCGKCREPFTQCCQTLAQVLEVQSLGVTSMLTRSSRDLSATGGAPRKRR